MDEKKKLKVKKRKIYGAKVKKLRAKGILPANIYGKKIKSEGVEVSMDEFDKIYSEAGETGVVELDIEGGAKVRSVLINNVHRDPVTDEFLHVDFHQVVLTEKMVADVPLEIEGEALAVKEKKGVFLTLLNEIEVEALPTDLPEAIKIDVSGLAELDSEIKVADLKVDPKIKIKTSGDLVVCKIGSFEKEEVVEKPAEEEVEGEEKPEEEVKEGDQPKEGEEKKAEEERKGQPETDKGKKEEFGKKEGGEKKGKEKKKNVGTKV